MFYFYVLFVVMIIWAVIQSWLHQARTKTVQPWKAFIHLFVWYLSYLFFPLLVYIIYLIYLEKLSFWFGVPMTLFVLLCIYARFIEPHTLRIQYHVKEQFLTTYEKQTQQSIKIALIADLHIGLFSGHRRQLNKIVKAIKQSQPDMVLVAGDWTYEPTQTLPQELQIFKQLDIPIYSVLGNHDEECPGPPIKDFLKKGLEQANIIDIEGCIIEYPQFYLVGVGDLWAGHAKMSLLTQCPMDKPYIIMAHNPDTIDLLPQLDTSVIMMSGHTHGGQVALPYLTDYYLRKTSILGHREGWYQHGKAELFVTIGTGMVGVPFRFLTPPTIDIIELK